MPAVLRIEPYQFFFVSLDRDESPHVHVSRDNRVAKFWLDPLALERAGGFGRAELNVVAAHVAEHPEMAQERWNGFFGD
jgi:hypothetical protein